MKVTLSDKEPAKINFQGFKPVKDEHGRKNYEFNFPFDDNVYDCYLEVYNLAQDKHGNYYVTDLADNSDTDDGKFKLKNGSNRVNLSSSYFIDENTPFAYHYKLVNKYNPHDVSFRVDAGDVIDNTSKGDYEIYNVVAQSGSRVAHGGSMKLVIPDNYNVGWQYNKTLFEDKPIIKNNNLLKNGIKSFKHFSNKLGGTLAGLEKAIDNGEFDGYTNIISLPIFTDDSLTAHGYWNKNCMQMSNSLGNINNYASLQRKMFAKGLNWVSDGAFVNEGLEGIHFANVLKWGEKSPYFNWFKASGLKNGPFLLGVFGKEQEFISHKIVNSPYNYNQGRDGVVRISKNSDYDKTKPTYIQIFDSRLVSDKLKNDHKNLITSYDILDTQNPYDINTHDDTVVNYHFEINPETYNSNVMVLNEYNKNHNDKINLNDYEGTRFVSKFETFELEEKVESNFDTWDSNTDIAKLNYVYSHSDTQSGKNLTAKQRAERDEILKRNTYEVQDYAVTSGAYWTQKTKDILTLHVAQNLKNLDAENPEQAFKQINDKIKAGIFPKRLSYSKEIVKNVINGKYDSYREFSDESYKNQVKMGLMNMPLDSVELGDNIAGVLASPYITKRAYAEDEVGVSRYDMYKKGNPNLPYEYKHAYNETQKMYDNEMSEFALKVLDKVQKGISEKLSSDQDASLYGKYVLPLVTPEIAKFAVIKALQPNAKVYVNNETGEIGYDYDSLKQVSLQSLNIHGASPEDEALSLIEKIRSGIRNISDREIKTLSDAIAKSLKGTSVESFALADMIIDRSQAGLDWRIDATKDIADIDAMRAQMDKFDYTYQQIRDFWKKFNDGVLKANPNAYLAAEVTDELDNKNSVRKLLNETGMTTTANYSYLFNGTIKMFGKKFEYDHPNEMEFKIAELPSRVYETMIGDRDYLRSSNLQSLLYSYTFIGNHDKPRALHCFSLDMDLFYADLTHNVTDKEKYHREKAFRILNDRIFGHVAQEEIENFDFSTVSPKAVAMADTMIKVFGDTLNELAANNENFRKDKDNINGAILKSIVDLANGLYLGERFNADAFAVKPFEVVIDTIINQAQQYHNLELDKEEIKLLKNEVFENILEPSYSRLVNAMKFLVAMPGKPTLFSGDDLGATGYEEKTKNIYLQNRNYLHNEWRKNKEFIKDRYNELKKIMALRSRPELDALNNGAPFTLALQNASNNGERTQLSAILRQNTDGKMAVSLFNTAGIHHNPHAKIDIRPMYLDNNRIDLNEVGNNGKIGLKGGLKEGAKFINANNPNDVYFVHKYGDKYYLEHHDRSPICVDDSTMILYHVPEKSQVAFTGTIDYKPCISDVSKLYAMN